MVLTAAIKHAFADRLLGQEIENAVIIEIPNDLDLFDLEFALVHLAILARPSRSLCLGRDRCVDTVVAAGFQKTALRFLGECDEVGIDEEYQIVQAIAIDVACMWYEGLVADPSLIDSHAGADLKQEPLETGLMPTGQQPALELRYEQVVGVVAVNVADEIRITRSQPRSAVIDARDVNDPVQLSADRIQGRYTPLVEETNLIHSMSLWITGVIEKRRFGNHARGDDIAIRERDHTEAPLVALLPDREQTLAVSEMKADRWRADLMI